MRFDRIEAGRAHCALCHKTVLRDEDAIITPDFVANDKDPLWRFSDAAMHRVCFLVWDRRKTLVARYNQLARRWLVSDGFYPHMTSEGDVVRRRWAPGGTRSRTLSLCEPRN